MEHQFDALDVAWVEAAKEGTRGMYEAITQVEQDFVQSKQQIVKTANHTFVVVPKNPTSSDIKQARDRVIQLLTALLQGADSADNNGQQGEEAVAITQIVGGMVPITPQSQAKMAAFLVQHLDETRSAIMSGHGGYVFPDSCVDVNTLVAKIASQNPAWASRRVVSNLHAHHAHCFFSKYRLQVLGTPQPACIVHMADPSLPWQRGQPPTVRFGDDALLTDVMTDHLVVLSSGGVQSFLQLLQFIQDKGKPENATIIQVTTAPQHHFDMFDVARALAVLQQPGADWAALDDAFNTAKTIALAGEYEQADTLEPEALEQEYARLSADQPFTFLFDPLKHHDARTKPKLWQRAKEVFSDIVAKHNKDVFQKPATVTCTA